jgi:hypothetical protein
VLPGFTPVCEQDVTVRERFALLTPPGQTFLTCLIDSKTYAAVAAERQAIPYPFIVFALLSDGGGVFSAEEFAAVKRAAHERMGDMIDDPTRREQAQAQLDAADEQLSATGVDVQRQANEYRFRGFFHSTDKSFSFLQESTTTVTAASVAGSVNEIQSVTVMLVEGRLLFMSMMDQHDGGRSAEKVRATTLQWLQEFSRQSQLSR